MRMSLNDKVGSLLSYPTFFVCCDPLAPPTSSHCPTLSLTVSLQMFIKRELNEFKKNEMLVHPDSRHNLRLH
jgi:hypothetical protein